MAYTHARGARAYLTVNTMPRTAEYPALRDYLASLRGSGIDALIVSDLGVLETAKELLPEAELHISTQASSVSVADVRAWRALGASRVVLARELTLDEVAAIVRAVPDTEIECFIHGAMCVSYSGRCLLSNFSRAGIPIAARARSPAAGTTARLRSLRRNARTRRCRFTKTRTAPSSCPRATCA